MRWTPADLLRDFEAFGLQFESLCVRDLRVYAVVTAGATAYRRDDGVLVIPLACLRP